MRGAIDVPNEDFQFVLNALLSAYRPISQTREGAVQRSNSVVDIVPGVYLNSHFGDWTSEHPFWVSHPRGLLLADFPRTFLGGLWPSARYVRVVFRAWRFCRRALISL